MQDFIDDNVHWLIAIGLITGLFVALHFMPADLDLVFYSLVLLGGCVLGLIGAFAAWLLIHIISFTVYGFICDLRPLYNRIFHP